MRYDESESLLASGKVSEAQLAPVDEFLGAAKSGWPLTAQAVAIHTGTPVAKVRLVLEALVAGGWFEAVESVRCPVDDCPVMAPRAEVESARSDDDEYPCSGCAHDLAAERDLEVVQAYRSLGQPLISDGE